MRILIIICSHNFDRRYSNNIEILNKYFIDYHVEYCGISNQNDFYVYEDIIKYKYKIINQKKQMGKICDFITRFKDEFNYDFYIKFRPEIRLLQPIDINSLSHDSIHARTRVYYGPSKIQYGMAVNGIGVWQNIGDCFYSEKEHTVILDDMLYIFHNNIVKLV
jgi:hypothetical protein